MKDFYSHIIATQHQLEVKRVKSKMKEEIMEQVKCHLENDNKYLQSQIDNLSRSIRHLKFAFYQKNFQLKNTPFYYSPKLNQSSSSGSIMMINKLTESINSNPFNMNNRCDIYQQRKVCTRATQTTPELINSTDHSIIQHQKQVCTRETQTTLELINSIDHSIIQRQTDEQEYYYQLSLDNNNSNDLLDNIFHIYDHSSN